MALSITDLPKELLALIFKNLTKGNDRRRVSQVNKLFYEIVRNQTTHTRSNMVTMMRKNSGTNPARVFQNSKFFPFSILWIQDWHLDVENESAFWSIHGQKIKHVVFFGKIIFQMEPVLSTLIEYFPNIKKLDIACTVSKSSEADRNLQNILLPIEDLRVYSTDITLDQILTFQRCSPLLKHLIISLTYWDFLPQLVPWLEMIESPLLNFDDISLEKLINLPSKIVIQNLTIKIDETPGMIREFFKRPRTIKTLNLRRQDYNEEFNADIEEDENNPANIYFTRDQVMALVGAKSIESIDLPYGVLAFEGSLDLLNQLPGLKSISLSFMEDDGIHNPLYPFYWSLPETAKKIHRIYNTHDLNLDYLAGLSSLTSFSIPDFVPTPRGLSSDEIQALIRNCPNLKRLCVPKIDVTDGDLIGHGGLLPISSLEKLKTLEIKAAPNITSEAFKSAFKFPNPS